jgi:hypothetical protein
MPEVINDDLIIRIVNKGINTLGENSAQLLWSLVEKNYGLSKNKIPENLPAFLEALQNTFGLGYSFLDSILQTLLQQAIGENLKEYKNFAQCVTDLRNKTTAPIYEKGEVATVESCMAIGSIER